MFSVGTSWQLKSNSWWNGMQGFKIVNLYACCMVTVWNGFKGLTIVKGWMGSVCSIVTSHDRMVYQVLTFRVLINEGNYDSFNVFEPKRNGLWSYNNHKIVKPRERAWDDTKGIVGLQEPNFKDEMLCFIVRLYGHKIIWA